MSAAERRRLIEAMDLSVECPHCHARLQPAEQQRLDRSTLRCPHCTQTFVVPDTAPSTS